MAAEEKLKVASSGSWKRRLRYLLLFCLAAAISFALLLTLAVMLAMRTLPSLDVLTNYRPHIPLRVYSAEGILIGEFGEENRTMVKIADVPLLMKEAILAAEDDRFYEHGGIDYAGVLRAAFADFISGHAKQGASTITMQVARNFFLTNGKTLIRKFDEMLLSVKIERSLSKDEILQIYINQIYLGQRAYGFAAAAQVYFGKPLQQLSIGEVAVLAGLPKAPSLYNPIVNPKRAKQRQLYVLRRMHELHFINDAEYQQAKALPLTRQGKQKYSIKADYVAEMVRQSIYELYQEAAYTQGLKVYTTIREKDQEAAWQALRQGVEDYDQRHGYRGAEGYYDLRQGGGNEKLEQALQDYPDVEGMPPGIITLIKHGVARVYCRGGQVIELSSKAMRLAGEVNAAKSSSPQQIRPGAVIRVQQNAKGSWELTQLPQVQAAFVSARPSDGAIYALVGGFDFDTSQFNHVTQAWRQPGSSFKPFIYSAALEKGFTPASVIDDAPLSFTAEQTGSKAWEPKNYEDDFEGPMSMREALAKSSNLVSIRILRAITPLYAQDYASKFGLDADKQPPYLTMALGVGSVTPLQMLAGYSVFANGGARISPYLISRIEDAEGNILSQAKPAIAGRDAPQVIDVRNAYSMVSMMQDVITHGTGRQAMKLGRSDLAGKTGTTSDYMDAWFCGFQPTVVAISWMGFDSPRSLGTGETGAHAALPIWINYMDKVLKDVPMAQYVMPDNMVQVRVDRHGLRNPKGARLDYFYQENLPPEASAVHAADAQSSATE